MNNRSPRLLLTHFLLAFAAFAFAGWAHADPPSRVARIAYVSGDASFSPGSEPDTWVHARINRPMVTGDRMWVERGARAELQLGQAAIRAAGGTSLSLLNLDDRVVQLQLNEGTLNVRVRRLDRGQTFEIDTPNLAYSIRRPGNYRIQVDPNGDATTVLARVGLAEAYGEGRAFVTSERVTYRFFGAGLREYQTFTRWGPDEFDRWASDRDRRWDNSASRRFVSTDMIGYEDLDANGTWRRVPDYGNVWIPNRVPANWAPYHDGHWAWVEPWGWTWIDDAPWGFAPSHYGRWAHLQSGWAWVPGPAQVQPVYAPALVAFVGGGNVRTSGGNAVAWFPLGPREVYRPSYTTSREYFERVNTTNTVVDRTTIVNVYNNPAPREVRYVNQQVPGALIAMLAVAFAESRPAGREVVHFDQKAVAAAPSAAVAPVAPVHTSVVGSAPATAKPPAATFTRPVVAQVAPPPPPVAFAAKQKQLEANVGKPHDAAAVAAATRPAQPPAAPQVKVVQAEKPVAAPAKPASAPEPKPVASAPAGAAAPAPAAPAPASSPPPPASHARGGASAPPTAAAPTPAATPASTPARAERPAPPGAPAASAAATRRDERDRAREERGRPGLGRPAAPEAANTPAPPAAPPAARPAASVSPAAPVTPAAPAATPAPRPAEAAREVRAASEPRRAPEARPAPESKPAAPPEAPRREAPPPRPAPREAAPATAPAPAAPATPQPPRAANSPATPAATPAPPAAAPAPRAASASTPPATPGAAAESRGAGQAAARREAASERREAASERRKQREEERSKP
jgi:hypothetical protein